MAKEKIIIPDLDLIQANRDAAQQALDAASNINTCQESMLGSRSQSLPYLRCRLREIIDHCDDALGASE